jgi:hypothetical protein
MEFEKVSLFIQLSLFKGLTRAERGSMNDDENDLKSAASLSSRRCALKLNKSLRNTIDEFLSKLERDLL